MPNRSIVASAARLVREFGGQVAISVAASAVAAAFLAAPDMLMFPDWTADAQVVRQAQENWISPISPDGKIAIRHRQAAPTGEVPATSALLMRSSLVMPMSAGWPEAVFAEAPVPSARVRSAEAHPVTAMATPARKAPAAVERAKAAESAPLPIIPVRLTTQAGVGARVADVPAQSSSGEAAPSTLARVGNAVSGAVGTVGAAGIWTLSQASSLLPRL